MDMGGITVRYAPGEAAVRAVLAGADALLMPPVPDAAFEGLQGAVRSGRISIERLDASVRRILEAKAMLGIDKTRIVDINAINQKLGSVAWQEEAQNISDRGITLLRDTPKALPIDGTKPNRALLLAFYADPEPYPGEDLERELKSRFDSVTTLRADTRFINASNLKLPDPSTYDTAILALFVRVSDRKGNVDVPAEQQAVADQLYKTGKPVITLGFGSPYLIERFPLAQTWLAAFGISDVAQISMARAMFGEIPIKGKLPVTIPGVDMKAGFGVEVAANPMTLEKTDVRGEALLRPAYTVVENAITDKAFPGATLAVGNKDKVAIHAFGNLSYDANSPAVDVRTMYDIASLTKVVVTTTLVAKLVEGDFPVGLDLDAKVERYLPELAADPNAKDIEWRHRVTVRHLMTHTSGLPPFKEYWRTSTSKQETLRRIFIEPLDYEPGTKEVYSDLGIILTAEIIERLTGRPLDELAKTYIFGPLGMKDTMYRPPKTLWPWIAPTEIDNNLRHRLVQGEVHDENAYSHRRRLGSRGSFRHGARSRGVLPDAPQWRRLRPSAHPEARHHRRIHRPAAAFERHPHAGLGRPNRRRLERTLLLEAHLRPHRLHRHLHLDRSGAPDLRRVPDQPREPHARKHENRQGAGRLARRGHAGLRLRRRPCSNSLTVNVSRHSPCCFGGVAGLHSYRTI